MDLMNVKMGRISFGSQLNRTELVLALNLCLLKPSKRYTRPFSRFTENFFSCATHSSFLIARAIDSKYAIYPCMAEQSGKIHECFLSPCVIFFS